jgi:SAM-dependent methyltransferase
MTTATAPAKRPRRTRTLPQHQESRPPKDSEPQQRAVPGVHDAARRLLSGLPRGRLLDVAAGNGAMSYWARANGFDVTALDIDRSLFELDDVPWIEADLNQRFPVEDNSADVVVACEIIEHLENHFQFLRELARVVRPGGHLILSTPNEHNLQCRWSYFTTGYFGHSPYVIREDDPRLPLRHINMVPLSKLELAWRRAGLELTDFTVSRNRKWSWLLFPWLYPLQTLRLKMRMKWYVRDAAARDLNAKVYRLVNDPRILLGRTIVYQLQKPLQEKPTTAPIIAESHA